MKLVWHIFKKDLRRLALPLVLWGALIVMQYLAWHASRAEEGESGEPGPVNLVILLWVLHLVAAWLLVPQLLRDDPLIGDRAGWRVRPIAGARLLAAKVLGWVLMACLWPSLLTIPWWCEFGFGAGEIARAVAVNLLGMALFTGLALMIAVLTENLARYVAWSIVMLVAAGLGWLTIVAEMPANGDGPVNAAVLITRATLGFGVMLTAAAVVVPMQFLGRRTGWARGLAAAAALVTALIVVAWPWSPAQMMAGTGLKAYALPAVTARVGGAMLVVPPDPAREQASVQVTTEFTAKQGRTSDFPMVKEAEPKWRFGDRSVSSLPIRFRGRSGSQPVAEALARGRAAAGADVHSDSWSMTWSSVFPGRLVPPLRTGEAAVSSSNRAAIWRGELGPTVPVRAGAGAARGFEQIHVEEVTRERQYNEWGYSYGDGVAWLQTELLFTPTVMLEMMNPDGMGGNRFRSALLMNDKKAILDDWPHSVRAAWPKESYLPGMRIPAGLIGATMLTSSFDRRRYNDPDVIAEGLLTEASTLTNVTFQEAAPMSVDLPETSFRPDLVVEGRLDDALRRAKAENKRVLVRVTDRRNVDGEPWIPESWNWEGVRALLVSRFVVVQVGPEEASRWQKAEGGKTIELVVLKASGEEQDQFPDLRGGELQRALQANVEGKSYATAVADALARRGGGDRNLRLQLYAALLARGDRAEAFDTLLWFVNHPGAPAEAAEMFGVVWRLRGEVEAYAPARAILLERRDRAASELRGDPRNVEAARTLSTITQALYRDGAIWQAFPSLLPRQNPLWWELTRDWIRGSVGEKHYREIVDAVDLEEFFAAGPAWARQQLAQKRTAGPGGPLVTVADWQRQLMRAGTLSIEALARAGRPEAALRIAIAARRINSSREARVMLARYLESSGAKTQARQLLKENATIP